MLTPAQVADAITSIGIEVDGVEFQEEIPGGLAGVVVAQVLECEPHPDSDHLHVTKVDAGDGNPVTVVCGAPNVAAGQKVLFATIGTVLPGDFKIKKSKIRGVESFGMICAADELGIGEDHSGIMVLEPEAVVGTPAKDYLHLKTEAVIEYEITANRVDAASHIGVARDLYAWLKLNNIPCKFKFPDVSAFREGKGEGIPVEVVDPTGAPRYSGVTVKGVKVGPSPEWLQKKLLAIGHNPINNVVDISNFVLFEIGQPLHTFDAAKIKGGKVIVRRAAQDEPIRTLDGVDRKLCDRDMVIANCDGTSCSASTIIPSEASAPVGRPARPLRNLPSAGVSVARKLQAKVSAQARLRAPRRQPPAIPTWTSVPGSMTLGQRPGSATILFPRSTMASAPLSIAPVIR